MEKKTRNANALKKSRGDSNPATGRIVNPVQSRILEELKKRAVSVRKNLNRKYISRTRKCLVVEVYCLLHIHNFA